MSHRFDRGRDAQGIIKLAFRCAAILVLGLCSLHAQVDTEPPTPRDQNFAIPKDLTLRARVTAITPSAPASIAWETGRGGQPDKLAENLAIGTWSPSVPVASLAERFRPVQFVTFLIGDAGKQGKSKDKTRATRSEYSKDIQAEFEFSYKGAVIKTCKEQGPDGGTITMVIPGGLLAGGKEPTDAAFLAELGGLLNYAQLRAEKLESLPWAKEPLPHRYMVASDLKGYGEGIGRGVLCTDKAVMEAEARSLHQLGANALRASPQFLDDLTASRTGVGALFTRGRIVGTTGLVYSARGESMGCPYAPGTTERNAQEIAARGMEAFREPVDEVFAITRDEISPIFNNSPEGRIHPTVCPYCIEAFRTYARNMGLIPADFGQADWSGVKPIDYWTWTMAQRGKSAAKKAPEGKKAPAAKNTPAGPAPQGTWLTDKGAAMAAYYTARFTNDATAASLKPIRDAYSQANEAKRKALASGDKTSAVAKQPWVYAYALRNPHFIDQGDGLDCFDYYRSADNAFLYETSGSVPQCMQWDSYLSDAARMITAEQHLQFGVYVKPSHGAIPIQRAISAISRNARLVYWYTYGPDWAWGDNFSQRFELLADCSRAARLIAKSEDVLYNSSPVHPAEVAVVNSRSAEIWMRLTGEKNDRVAAWENGKWIYSALAHAHIPVDPLDEVMLANNDLSRYKIIYFSGANITRAAAAKLADYVKAGGTLYTSGGGLAYDEANQPLGTMKDVLGLESRQAMEMWTAVPHDGAKAMTAYEPNAPKPATEITGSGAFKGAFAPVVGRERLVPTQGTEVLAKFSDGTPAATRHAYGKGQAYVLGFFPGLEYQAKSRRDDYDLSKDYDAEHRSFVVGPALELIKPAVACDQPTVESVLLKNNDSGKRAVTLVNWTFRATAPDDGAKARPEKKLVSFQDLKVTIRSAGDLTKATSAATGKALPVAKSGADLIVTVPRLAEADVLLLE